MIALHDRAFINDSCFTFNFNDLAEAAKSKSNMPERQTAVPSVREGNFCGWNPFMRHRRRVSPAQEMPPGTLTILTTND